MGDDNGTPIGVDNDNAPFSGPYPDADEIVSTRPETDSDIDEQEFYDEGLAGAAEIGEEETDDESTLPEGFHIE